MAISGRSFDPTSNPPPPQRPVVDYTLARRAALSAVRRGLIGTTDVCDAHPELMRAGKNIGEVLDEKCPICSHETLRRVSYVYGDELKTNSGRVVYPEEWLTELIQRYDQFTCYVVEVCIDCAWNHLVRSYVTGRRWGEARFTQGRRTREHN